MRPGIVHRIDKDTSGLLVVAKNDEAHRALSEELKYHGIVREYHALVKGGFSDDGGTVDMPIGRHPEDRKRMAVFKSAGVGVREAVTHYSVLRRYDNVSYLKLVLETGRTHQIRVQFSSRGFPLVGDHKYGARGPEKQIMLFSCNIRFMLHGKMLEFSARPCWAEDFVKKQLE